MVFSQSGIARDDQPLRVEVLVLLKYFHILIAIIALGTSAGLGVLLEFYGNHPVHGLFVLRAIRRLIAVVVLPGYGLMVVTGLWMTHLSWSFTMKWIQAALVLWAIGAVLLAISLAGLRAQIEALETSGPGSPSYKRASARARVLGAGVGLVIVTILYLMVVKPRA